MQDLKWTKDALKKLQNLLDSAFLLDSRHFTQNDLSNKDIVSRVWKNKNEKMKKKICFVGAGHFFYKISWKHSEAVVTAW